MMLISSGFDKLSWDDLFLVGHKSSSTFGLGFLVLGENQVRAEARLVSQEQQPADLE